MSRQNELNSYIAQLQRRLRFSVSLRGAAIFILTALAATVVLVVLLNRYAFPARGVSQARMALMAVLAIAAVTGFVWPLVQLTRARAISRTEQLHPELQQRLTTFHEHKSDDPFLELLAADTLAHTESVVPAALAPTSRLLAFGGAGLVSLGLLLWMITSAPGYMGYGASLLWTGEKKNAAPLYSIAVKPGDVAVRRNSDQLVTAEVQGLRPEKVQIFAHYQSAAGWEPVAMQAQPGAGAATYQFLFAGLPESVEYYVAAGPLVSPHYKVRVVDLPSVKAIRVTYNYPKWTGMKPVIDDHSGDLRAIEGTDAEIEVEMDRPLKDSLLTLDDGKSVSLTNIVGNRYKGHIQMQKDGAYHVASTDAGQPVRLSEDYFIATDKIIPPDVALVRPGGDYRASPIEEVTVGVKASDSFGLNDVHLHYSVNGGADHDVSMLKESAAKSADGTYTLRLEDFKLVPGDLVSLYATARDGHGEARTAISFIQAEPFEREFSQSQESSAGGGGQGGQQSNNQTEISKREKELIAATWKQQNDKTATPKDAEAAGQFLAEAQQKLRDQVNALSARIQSRDLSEATEEFTDFDKDMAAAAAAMQPSADKLKAMQWSDAIPIEQKALQALLRAEATFRKIQTAFNSRAGSGGGGGSAGRDLASLFELELDTEKNQYETSQSASPAEEHEKEVDSALQKLDALAKRQEELANQQPNPQQAFQQRWQQEMLRREAEELQRQMEQLAKNNQGQQSQSPSPSSSTQSPSQSKQQSSSNSQAQEGSQSRSSSSNQQAGQQSSSQQASGQQPRQPSGKSGEQQRLEDAVNRVRQATDAMKRGPTPGNSADAAKQAADRLRDATNLLGSNQQQLASGKVDSLSHQADQLVQQQRAQADRIDKLANSTTDPSALTRDEMMARLQERDRLAAERQQLSNQLSGMQKDMRGAARELASSQPGASQKLRDALTEMDQEDLDNHVQRTADWLRSGINPNSNGTESEISKGLQDLDQKLKQAQQAINGQPGNGRQGQQRGQGGGDQTAALGQVERLRRQIEALSGSRNQQPGQSGQGTQQGQNGQRKPSGNQQDRGNTPGQQPGAGRGTQQSAQNDRGDQGGTQNAQQGGTGQRGGGRNGQANGEVRNSGGGGEGAVWGNINTGNNQYGQGSAKPVSTDASGNPADTELAYQQGLRELRQLRQSVQGDPQIAKDLQDLTRQMQQLDPSRFPGNPQMVEQMHHEMLSAIDKIELQIHHNESLGEARAVNPDTVPTGYQDSVAEYYKHLSSKR